MKLTFNGARFDVPRATEEKLLSDLLAIGEQDYHDKVPKHWRILAKPFSRALIGLIESEVSKTGGKAAAAQVRPPARDTDPNLWLARLFAGMLLEGLKHIELIVNANDHGSIDGFNLVVESAGQAG